MPRRTQRWTPPHPDPAKMAPTHPMADLLPRSQRCTWNDCMRPRYLRLPLCVDHSWAIVELLTSDREDLRQEFLAREIEINRANAKADREADRKARLRATRGMQPGWIYYVLTDGKVKIGYSGDITRRLRAYPPGSDILAVHPGTPDLEKQIHHGFDAHRVAGREWFRPDPEILEHCARVVEEHGDPKRYAPKVRDPHAKRTVGGRNWSGTKKTAA